MRQSAYLFWQNHAWHSLRVLRNGSALQRCLSSFCEHCKLPFYGIHQWMNTRACEHSRYNSYMHTISVSLDAWPVAAAFCASYKHTQAVDKQDHHNFLWLF